MSREDAIKIVTAAIEAGIYHDLGSGSNVDVCLITKDKVEYLRNLKTDNYKMYEKPEGYTFKKERCLVLDEYKHKLEVATGPQPM